MNIAIFTNTYKPHVGGVANSVERLEGGIRDAGHNLLIVAPTYDGESDDDDVIRLAAIQDFNGSDFSVTLPVPAGLGDRLREFKADVLHAQHPFLLGDAALRWAESQNIPLVFTHHTMYENYTHYVPADSEAMKRFVVNLCTGYANFCDHVIAPSSSIARILRERGVTAPITPIPTGVDFEQYNTGDGIKARSRFHIDPDALVIGHVGRLAPEKNLRFLIDAATPFLASRENAHLLIVGDGPEKDPMAERLAEEGLGDRCHFTGVQTGQDLVDLYHAMDIFVFASKSETQGMVLAEAMAAGVPVVALDANGVRDIVTDGADGILIQDEDREAFAEALTRLTEKDQDTLKAMSEKALAKAADYSISNCVDRVLEIYDEVHRQGRDSYDVSETTWEHLLGTVRAEWDVWSNRLNAVVEAFGSDDLPGMDTE